MTHRYRLTLKSGNRKTGSIPVSVSSSSTCPPACGQQDTCYARFGPLSWHWKAIDAGRNSTDLQGLCADIAALPPGQLWRHNAAGDLPGRRNRINRRALGAIVAAQRGKRGFTYTHYPLSPSNAKAICDAIDAGFTINVSADTIQDADRYRSMGFPVAVALPEDLRTGFTTPGGNRVVICPATITDTTCAECQLCQKADRKAIVGFPAHGTRKARITRDMVFGIAPAGGAR